MIVSAFAADLIVVLHSLYVGVVVLSVPLIIIGGWRGWGWVTRPWFRLLHLGMIAVVAAESVLGIRCPLTVWERALRGTGDHPADRQQDFVAGLLDRLLFYNFPHWVFTATYMAFGLLVLALLWLVPMQWHRTN